MSAHGTIFHEGHYGLRTVTPAAVEPVTLGEAKGHARVTQSKDDSLVEIMIAAAREQAELFLNRQLITATLEMTLDRFPGGAFNFGGILHGSTGTIFLPRSPLQTVNSIDFVDVSGSTAPVALADVKIDSNSEPARITPKVGFVWPVTELEINSVIINYDAGYGPAETDVPGAIRLAILMGVADFYEHREAWSEIKLMENSAFTNLLWIHRVYEPA